MWFLLVGGRLCELPRTCPVLFKGSPRFPYALPRQIGFHFARRVFQITPGDHVISIEHAPCLVAAGGHCNAFWHVRPNKIADAGASETVEQKPHESGVPAGGLPSFVETTDTLAVARENENRLWTLLELNF